uniref:Solute carrier family 35 member F2 n=1 Tax=Junco hyemalis TaxID=40217 RepID=A0A8C5NJ91_JUNHY
MEEAAAAAGAPRPADATADAEAADAADAADAAHAADAAEPSPGAAASSPRRLLALLGAKLCTWHIWKTVILGQMLSMFICGTAVTSQYLADRFNVNTPMLQSFINYCLLLLVYTTTLVFRTGSDSLCQILKQRWWKYLIVGLADVEANYTIVKAYQYTNLTSVQLLDCFGIPVLMALSWFLLRARYKLIHFVAVAICLLGVATMVGADILAGREEGEALLFTAFALCMFGLYSFMPVVIKITSATSVNLAILTSDLYSLFIGLYLFYYKFSGLYIVSFVIIMVGFTLYCAAPPATAEPTAVPQPGHAGLDNAALKLEETDGESPEVAVQSSREETEVLSTN